MMVKTGWNSEFGMEKFDVGLGEEDLARILADRDIPPDTLLTPVEAFKTLYFEAEYFSEMMKYSKLQDEQSRKNANAAKLSLDEHLGKIRARLGVEQS